MKKRGTCLCHCGGNVVDENNTTLDAYGQKFISCKRCYKVWNADYAFSVRPERGIIELDESEEWAFVREMRKGDFI